MEVSLDSIKSLKIYQKKTGYRFTIDSLLLVDFVNLTFPKKIADLGAGSGIIGILLAKRYTGARVLLIEVQKELVELSRKNIEINMVSDRVMSLRGNIKNINNKHIKPNSFNLVVSNPPFRKPLSGKVSPNSEKAISRHEISITLDDFINAAFYILRGKGRLCFIYHPSRLIEVIETLKDNRFEPKRIRFIHSFTHSDASMFLIEAVKEGRPQLILEKPFFIYNKKGEYTEDSRRILELQ